GELEWQCRLGADLMNAATAAAALRSAPWRPWGWFRHWLALAGFSGRWAVILPPLLWLLVFFLVPLVVVIKIGFSASVVGQPPYLPLLTFSPQGDVQMTLHLSNFIFLAQDHLYLDAYLSSLKI